MSCTQTNGIQNASQVDVSIGLQNSFGTPNYQNIEHINAQTTDPSQGTVTIQTKTRIGAKTNFDVQKTLTNVDKSITIHNTPNQLNTLSQWAFGEPTYSDDLHLELLQIINNNSLNNPKITYSVVATAETVKLIKNDTSTGVSVATDLASVNLPTAISGVITAINAVTGFSATQLIGSATTQWNFVGTVALEVYGIVPATTTQSTEAQISIYSPLSNCPKFATLIHTLFKDNTTEKEYRADVDCLVQSMNITLPKDDTSTIEISYLASKNLDVPSVSIGTPKPNDTATLYKSSEGLYDITLGEYQFPTITEVSSSLTLTNNPDKGWKGNQLNTGISSFMYESQINAYLTKEIYTYITNSYETNIESESYIPTIMRILNQQFVDETNSIPYQFMYIIPRAKITQAPTFTVEAGATIPFPFTIQATDTAETTDFRSLYFVVIHKKI